MLIVKSSCDTLVSTILKNMKSKIKCHLWILLEVISDYNFVYKISDARDYFPSETLQLYPPP